MLPLSFAAPGLALLIYVYIAPVVADAVDDGFDAATIDCS